MPFVEPLAVHHQRGEQRRVAGVLGPQLAARRVRRARAVASSSCARMMRWRVRRRGCSASGGSSACSSARSRRGDPRRIAGSTGGRRSRSASAARRYRPVPPTTIGRRPLRRSGRRSPRARAGRTRPPRTSRRWARSRAAGVRARACSRRVGGPGQDRQALVDLHRVRGDRDRVLSALAQALGERDGDGGLADAGRPEDGDDLHGRSVSSPGHVRPHRHRPVDRARAARGRAGRRDGGAPPSSATQRCDLVVVFVSGGCARGARAGAGGRARDPRGPKELIGCGAGGVIGHGQEVENGTAVSVWAATWATARR